MTPEFQTAQRSDKKLVIKFLSVEKNVDEMVGSYDTISSRKMIISTSPKKFWGWNCAESWYYHCLPIDLNRRQEGNLDAKSSVIGMFFYLCRSLCQITDSVQNKMLLNCQMFNIYSGHTFLIFHGPH